MTHPHAIERDVSHRPWPLPSSPWVLYQEWHDLLFAHWRIPRAALRARVPPSLEIEEFDGSAWIGLTPFLLRSLRPRGLPRFPPLSDFPELNVRTYVRAEDRPGVLFFSLDAGSRAAVLGARALYRLPYHEAEMEVEREGEWLLYESRRKEGEATFRARYRPSGSAAPARAGTLEHFLTERYALYAPLGGDALLRAEIHHPPWRLQPAEADIEENGMLGAAGLDEPSGPPLLHFSKTQSTLTWLPERVEG